MKEKKGMDRRSFLRNSALGVSAVGAASTGLWGNQNNPTPQPEVNTTPLKVKEYRTLGRTGFKVSDISCGYVKDPTVLEKYLDAGVNYIDTAEEYQNEQLIGNVIKNRDRKSLFITSKLVIKEDVSKEGFIARTHKCLERLQTNYIDCMMMHSVENVKTLQTEGFHAAMEQLKKEGKIRFVGVSNHGSNFYTEPEESMEKVLTAAALDGRFDVMLLAYNFIQNDNGEKVLKLCREKNIGTTLMKVNPIGKIKLLTERMAKLKEEGKEVPQDYLTLIAKLEGKAKIAADFIAKYKLDDADRMRDAAIRFVLSNPDMHTVCCAVKSFDDIDTYVSLSGTRLTDMDNEKLAAYKEGCGSLYCRHACGLCEPSCPHKVPVNSIMRFNHYFEAQGKEKYAMQNYARLTSAKADLCATCPGHCEKACPHGVPIHGLLYMAHRTLSLA